MRRCCCSSARNTREAGLRNLERELASLVRKAVKELTLQKIDQSR
jgi:ATP-dependent Lon protease